jgi:hypothetical protein
MLISICFGFMMFIVSLVEFSKHVQNEISAKVMPKPQNFIATEGLPAAARPGLAPTRFPIIITAARDQECLA